MSTWRLSWRSILRASWSVDAAQGRFDHDSPSEKAKLLQAKKNI
jgi:hypothetical protein